MSYDTADRLVATQNGTQYAEKKWIINRYDKFNRLVYSFITISTQKIINTILKSSTVNEVYNGNAATGGYTLMGGTLTELGINSLLTVNYYDDYSFLNSMSDPQKTILTCTTLSGYTPPAATPTAPAYAKTLLTGSRVYHLDDPTKYEVTAFYYDKYGRTVQTRATNHLEGYDIAYNELDFTGKPTKTYKTHAIHGESATITELYTYSYYDNDQRLKTTTYSLNGATPVILAVNSYDQLGRLTGKLRHNNAETTHYGYNVRSWITSINNSSWKEQIYYQDDPTHPLYNGNIARSDWTYSRRPNRGYRYTYDGLNRLTRADYGECSGLSQKQHLYDEYFGYDKMGNITSIQRFCYSLIDNLTLTYKGNQLQKGDDTSGPHSGYNSTEYTDYSTNVASDYVYDANGNMTQNLDKDIVAIRYNVLNLPDIIQFKNGNQVINMYNANGQKLRTKYYTAISSVVNPVIVPVGIIHAPYSTSDATLLLDDYLGSTLYEKGTAEDAAHHPLTKVLTPEGYVDYNTPGQPNCYFRKDHLGSIREVDTYLGSDRKVVQKTQYYPSGTPFEENFGAGVQPYKFTGKEMITMHGLNWQDFGARWLDNVRMQFTSMDPLAEKYYSISPYAYCAGNPVNRIDPDGMTWDDQKAADELVKNVQDKITYLNDVSASYTKQLNDVNLTDDQVKDINDKISALSDRVNELNASIDDIKQLGDDEMNTYVLNQNGGGTNGDVTQESNGKVSINAPTNGLALHEIKHITQSEIAGGLKFINGKLQNAGRNGDEKINNEVQSYKAQFSLNGNIPGGVPIWSPLNITPTMVRNMRNSDRTLTYPY